MAYWFHMGVNEMDIISLRNGLSPSQCQTTTQTNGNNVSIEPLDTSLSEICIQIHVQFCFSP